MFWRFGLCAPSAIDVILDKPDFTLEDLLDEEELLQECKGHNKRLVEYLSRPEVVEKLFDNILRVNVISHDDPQLQKLAKYSYQSCEVFGCEMYDVFDTLFANPAILDKFFGLLSREPPLPAIVPCYFHRCVLTLLQKKANETIAYMEGRPRLLEDFARHVNDPNIKDTILAVCFSDEATEGRSTAFLLKHDFVRLFVTTFCTSADPDVHENVSQLLAELVCQSSSFSNESFYTQLQSEEIVDMLLTRVLSDTPTRTLQFGLNILIEIIGHHAEGKIDPTADQGNENLPGMIRAIRGRLPALVALLQKAPETLTSPVSRPPPFGLTRLRLMDFFLVLLRTRYIVLDKDLTELKLLSVCLDLFFKHPFNNFLHSAVEEIINLVLIGESDVLTNALFGGCRLTHILVFAFKSNEANKLPKGMRVCYMGHLIRICNRIVEACANSAALSDAIRTAPPADLVAEWQEFVGTTLQEQNRIQETALGGVSKPAASDRAKNNNDDDDDDDDELFQLDDPGATNEIVQQAFSKYLTDKVSLGHFSDDFDDDNRYSDANGGGDHKAGGGKKYDDEDDDDEDEDGDGDAHKKATDESLAKAMDGAHIRQNKDGADSKADD